MKDFAGRIAVITGGGTGMGRELARQLVAEGCNVAMCDVSAAAMAETMRLCEVDRLPQGLRITTHLADVSDEADVMRFADEVAKRHDTDKIHLLFNNAGIGGGGSMIVHERAEWERTFNVCWGGVYYGARAFLPMMLKADRGHIVNTSSVNGFWASLGPAVPHTAYCAAKFAVKGFTEALITDLRLNAPHIKCSVVMPGHIGTSIVTNSRKIQGGNDSRRPEPAELAQLRARVASMGVDVSTLPTTTSPSAPTNRPAASSRTPRPPPPRPPRSSSTASRPSAGASWSATTPTRWTPWSARSRNRPTTPISSDPGQGSRLEARRQLTEPSPTPLVSLYRKRSDVMTSTSGSTRPAELGWRRPHSRRARCPCPCARDQEAGRRRRPCRRPSS